MEATGAGFSFYRPESASPERLDKREGRKKDKGGSPRSIKARLTSSESLLHAVYSQTQQRREDTNPEHRWEDQRHPSKEGDAGATSTGLKIINVGGAPGEVTLDLHRGLNITHTHTHI